MNSIYTLKKLAKDDVYYGSGLIGKTFSKSEFVVENNGTFEAFILQEDSLRYKKNALFIFQPGCEFIKVHGN